ncbi:MAG: nicotinamidase [Isosphaeraceae bacterium]|jgi:nicotinamidase/pyrazinamidase|nr:MAG: nicotinamidase [Isosphaeraceae bacterium]
MNTPRLIFVDIDTQRDFLDPNGALSVPDAQAIRPNLARLIQLACQLHLPVIASACAHRLDDPDPEPFPPHCLVGTPGHDRIPETNVPTTHILGPDHRDDLPASARHITLHKRTYDVFSNPHASRLVTTWGGPNARFVVFGVATDYCVRAAVLGLLDRGQQVWIVADAIRAVDPTAEPAILTDLVRRGATLTVTDRICRDALASLE